MALPPSLQEQIQSLLKNFPQKNRVSLQEVLSKKYRTSPHKALSSKEEVLLYIITRLPATYHVGENVLRVFKELWERAPVKTILDLGAGVGSSRWLFDSLFPGIDTLTLVEQNPFMLESGKAFSHALGHFETCNYVTDSLTPHDLIFMSYTMSEVDQKHQEKVLKKVWDQTNQVLILIEPGTPAGFWTLNRARTFLIQQGGYILAPCGHEATCPMVMGENWCHFSTRLPRTLDHQRAKRARLSHEDEKFSYLIVSKTPLEKNLPPRIIQKPMKAKGHVIFDVCTLQGIKRETVTRSKAPDYKTQSRLEWGEKFSLKKLPEPLE